MQHKKDNKMGNERWRGTEKRSEEFVMRSSGPWLNGLQLTRSDPSNWSPIFLGCGSAGEGGG